MEKKIETTANLVKMFIDHTPIAYVILDRNYRIHYINDSFAKLRKLDMKTTIGNKCYNLSNGGVRCAKCAVANAFETGKKTFVRRKDILQEGTVRFIDDYAIPLQLDKDGNIEFILEIMIDRTQELVNREQKNKDYDEILSVFTSLLEAKDSYTAFHSENVRRLSLNLARAMGLTPDEVFEVSVAASLHDIGKVKVPDSIINKNGRPTEEEIEIIKNHPIYTYEMLKAMSSFGKIRKIARHHHERVDGRGYPDGICGEELSIGAKIVAVADTYDAITTTRSYSKARSHEEAVAELKKVSGTQLDAEVVNAFVQMDFVNMVEKVYDLSTKNKRAQIERVITQANLNDFEPEMAKLSNVDLENLFFAIFESTPCGYVMMNRAKEIVFASEHFMEYMEIGEGDVLGRRCSDVMGLGECVDCVVDRAVLSRKVERSRQETLSKSRIKIFDVFAVPLVEEDDTIENIIEIIIDRTEEVSIERAREKDFLRLIDMLSDVFESKKEDVDEKNLSPRIIELRKSLGDLMKKKH